MDNRDGTLSIFGTLIDHGAALATPPPAPRPTRFTPATLAADRPRAGVQRPAGGRRDGVGKPEDRNVELLLPTRT